MFLEFEIFYSFKYCDKWDDCAANCFNYWLFLECVNGTVFDIKSKVIQGRISSRLLAILFSCNKKKVNVIAIREC